MVTHLSPREKDCYRHIRAHIRAHGWAPTFRELAAYMGTCVRVTWVRVDAMAKKGYLRMGGGPREIMLLRSLNGERLYPGYLRRAP